MGILGMGSGKDFTDHLMGIFDGYLICTDCDGTLTDSQSELSDENIEAIRYFQKEGGLFTLATGRYPKYVNRFRNQFDPNTYLVMGNGTMLLAPVKAEGIEKGQFSPSYEEPVLIREIVFPKTPREEVLFMVEECGCEVMFTDLRNRSESWMAKEGNAFWNNVLQETEHDLEKWFSRLDERYQEWKVHPNDLTHAVLPHKVIFVFDTPEKTLQAKKMAMERFPEGDFERSWPTGLELLSPGAGKGNAVCFLREVLEKEGRPVKKLICAGDFENDISMIKAADMGYAVANATPDCKEAADRVTVSCDENAIAVIIRELEEEMG